MTISNCLNDTSNCLNPSDQNSRSYQSLQVLITLSSFWPAMAEASPPPTCKILLYSEPDQDLDTRAAYLTATEQDHAYSWMLNQSSQSTSSDKFSPTAYVEGSKCYCFPLQ